MVEKLKLLSLFRHCMVEPLMDADNNMARENYSLSRILHIQLGVRTTCGVICDLLAESCKLIFAFPLLTPIDTFGGTQYT